MLVRAVLGSLADIEHGIVWAPKGIDKVLFDWQQGNGNIIYGAGRCREHQAVYRFVYDRWQVLKGDAVAGDFLGLLICLVCRYIRLLFGYALCCSWEPEVIDINGEHVTRMATDWRNSHLALLDIVIHIEDTATKQFNGSGDTNEDVLKFGRSWYSSHAVPPD
jgi:hypothetical protein